MPRIARPRPARARARAANTRSNTLLCTMHAICPGEEALVLAAPRRRRSSRATPPALCSHAAHTAAPSPSRVARRVVGLHSRGPITVTRHAAVFEAAAPSQAAGAGESEPERVGVLLLNLGGPETLEDVQPFLYNLFADPDILRLKPPLAPLQPLVAAIISTLRAPKVRPQRVAQSHQAAAGRRWLLGPRLFLALPSLTPPTEQGGVCRDWRRQPPPPHHGRAGCGAAGGAGRAGGARARLRGHALLAPLHGGRGGPNKGGQARLRRRPPPAPRPAV